MDVSTAVKIVDEKGNVSYKTGRKSLRCYTESGLLRKLRNSFDSGPKGDYIELLHHLIDDDIIILDDVGSAGHTDWREEVLFEILDYRMKNGLQTVITSNLTENQMEREYHKRISSRMFARNNCIIDLESAPDIRKVGIEMAVRT